MEYSKIVVIGAIADGSPFRIMKVYERLTGDVAYETFEMISSQTFAGICKKSKDEREQIYKKYENTILGDSKDCNRIFCFYNMEDFEAFDIYGILKKKALFITKLEDSDLPMTIYQLFCETDKQIKLNKSSNKKVVMVNTATGNEYFIGGIEPRRFQYSEADTTVEFSIYPIKKESIKGTPRIKLAKYIQKKLSALGKPVGWLANEMNIPASSLYGKFDRDSFNGYDLIKIIQIFGMDASELTDNIII